jgi:hypothetical protein
MSNNLLIYQHTKYPGSLQEYRSRYYHKINFIKNRNQPMEGMTELSRLVWLEEFLQRVVPDISLNPEAVL